MEKTYNSLKHEISGQYLDNKNVSSCNVSVLLSNVNIFY